MSSSKVCFKCQLSLPLSQFYRHSAMADGHLNKCKACTKADVSAHRLANIDRIRAYDRKRAKNKERIAAAMAFTKEWRAVDKRRVKCHNAVARAIKSGRLKPEPCERCGEQKSLAHHDSYDHPLAVRWVCYACHRAIHKEMRDAGLVP